MTKKFTTFRYSFKASLPILAGYLVLGMGFGVIFASKGYSVLWAMFTSITVYSGSLQYVAADLLSNEASLFTVVLMTFMINIRHIFYGITMLEKYRFIGMRKPFLIFAMTDETFSLVCSPKLPEGVSERNYFLYISILNYIYWISGCTLGAALGSSIAFNSAGIDFAMTALFVIIFVEQWESVKNHKPALSGLLVTATCLIIFGATNFLIPSMIGIVIVLFAGKKYMLEENAND